MLHVLKLLNSGFCKGIKRLVFTTSAEIKVIHKVKDFSCSHEYLSGRVGLAIDTLVEKKHLDIIYHLGRWSGGEVAS